MHNRCLINAQFVCPLKILNFRNPVSKRLTRILTRARGDARPWHTVSRAAREWALRWAPDQAFGSPSLPHARAQEARRVPGPCRLTHDRYRPTTPLRGLGASCGRDTHFRSSMTLACSFSSLMSTRRFTVFLPLSSPGGPQDAPGLRYSTGSWKSKCVCLQHHWVTQQIYAIPKMTHESKGACKNQRHLRHIQYDDWILQWFDPWFHKESI